MTDAELVRLARDGQVTALEQLAHRWAARVLAVCRARLGSLSAAEDAAQETLLRGFQSLHSLEHPEKFGAWLRGIAVRVCCDWLQNRRNHEQPRTFDNGFEPLDVADPPVQQLEHTESRQKLLSEVLALPEELRETILLYYFDDVTYLDLAEMLGVSRATVNARLAKARSLLAKRLAHLVR